MLFRFLFAIIQRGYAGVMQVRVSMTMSLRAPDNVESDILQEALEKGGQSSLRWTTDRTLDLASMSADAADGNRHCRKASDLSETAKC